MKRVARKIAIFLASIFALSGCNSLENPDIESSTESPTEETAESPAEGDRFFYKETKDSITSDDINILEEVGVPIILPTYIPSGVKFVGFKSTITPYTQHMTLYQGSNNSYFDVYAVSDDAPPTGSGAIHQELSNIEHKDFGNISLIKVIGHRTSLLIHFRNNNANYYIEFTSGGKQYNSISIEEMIKVAKSLEYKKP